jgi:hypothetical protein
MNKKPSEMTLTEFNDLINQEPPETKTDSETGYIHIPIGFLEKDLRDCFEGLVVFQKTPNQQLFNAVDCDAKIMVFHPVLKVWLEFHGTGTVLIESITQGKYADTTKVVKENDESLATSRAFAEAKKSAAKGIGPRFGSNLNRENAPGKQPNAYDILPPIDIEELIKNKASKSELLHLIAAGRITAEQKEEISKQIKKNSKEA